MIVMISTILILLRGVGSLRLMLPSWPRLLMVIGLGWFALLITAYTLQPVSLETITYQGWAGSIQAQTTSLKLIAVPSIGRIMHVSQRGYPNLIWQEPYFRGKLADPEQTQLGYWYNFGGGKLWVAPQSQWRSAWGHWPPDYALDGAPCTSTIEAPDTFMVESQPSSTTGITFRRRVQIRDQGADFTYTMINTSSHQVDWGIWMVLQAVGGGRIFLPATDQTQFWLDPQPNRLEASTPEAFGYQKIDQVYVVDHVKARDGSKLFSIPDQGWLAYRVQNQVFFLLYPADRTVDYPQGEGSTEIYISGAYVELEHVGPLMHLIPGESGSIPEFWRVVLVPELNHADEELSPEVAWIQATARSLMESIS